MGRFRLPHRPPDKGAELREQLRRGSAPFSVLGDEAAKHRSSLLALDDVLGRILGLAAKARAN
jgi:hypothetical protein